MDLPWLQAEGVSAKDLFILEKYQQRPKDPTEELYTSAEKTFAMVSSPIAILDSLTNMKHTNVSSYTTYPTSQSPHVLAPKNKNMTHTYNHGNRIIYTVLFLLDGTISLLRKEQQWDIIKRFKADMCKNLDNERQLYKIMGFHRKKTMTVEGMKNHIMSDNLDTTADEAIWTYIVRLLQRDLHVVSLTSKTRMLYPSPTQPPRASPVLYLFDSHEVHELQSSSDNNCNYIGEVSKIIADKLPKATDVVNMTLADLRAWTKFFDIKDCKTKVAMSAALGALFASSAPSN